MPRTITSTHSSIARRQRRGLLAPADAGWTLIEMLVVLSLIAILAMVAMAQYRNSVRAAEEASLRSTLFIVRDALDQHYADKGKYPESLDALVSARYLRAMPRDPVTRSTDTWEIVEAEAEPGTTQTAAGVYSIKSGSQDLALDGTRYNDW